MVFVSFCCVFLFFLFFADVCTYRYDIHVRALHVCMRKSPKRTPSAETSNRKSIESPCFTAKLPREPPHTVGCGAPSDPSHSSKASKMSRNSNLINIQAARACSVSMHSGCGTAMTQYVFEPTLRAWPPLQLRQSTSLSVKFRHSRAVRGLRKSALEVLHLHTVGVYFFNGYSPSLQRAK